MTQLTKTSDFHIRRTLSHQKQRITSSYISRIYLAYRGRISKITVLIHFNCHIHRLQQTISINVGKDNACLVQCLRALRKNTDTDCRNQVLPAMSRYQIQPQMHSSEGNHTSSAIGEPVT
jgi:hypothetical protein